MSPLMYNRIKRCIVVKKDYHNNMKLENFEGLNFVILLNFTRLSEFQIIQYKMAESFDLKKSNPQ